MLGTEIKLQVKNHIATLTLNRPAKLNPISYGMWIKLNDLFSTISEMDDARVLLLRGSGDKSFSVGADIGDFDKHRKDLVTARAYSRVVEDAMKSIECFSKPTIAMIKGYCLGGGFELATACDIRIAATNVLMGIPAARLGLTIGYHEARRLVNIMGRSGALYTLLTGRNINGNEALARGLIHELVDGDSIETYTYRLAYNISQLAPLSHSIHKTIVNTVIGDPGLINLTEKDLELPLSVFETQDFREGRSAFLGKRPPQFKGS